MDTESTTSGQPERVFTVGEAQDIITTWFLENFYNRALNTEYFNFSQTVRDDLLERFKGN
jgi:hypothetical protein